MIRLMISVLILNFSTGCYSFRQAWHQNTLLNQRQKIDEVIASPTTSDATREKLILAKAIVAFARQQGLNTGAAYRDFIQLENDAISYLVQAAPTTSLRLVTWWFPVAGSVPYLGFFSKEERDNEARLLQEKGYDVSTSTVGAFSSLGWFGDPVFSPMLRRDEANLAHLLFHELTHRTYWSSGNTEFNENLAEYVAKSLTVLYLQERGDENALAIYRDRLEDKVLYYHWLKALKNDIKRLYEESKALPIAETLRRKQEIFDDHKTNKSPKFRGNYFNFIKTKNWNNASLMGAVLYSPDIDRFETAHRCSGGGSIADFLHKLKRKESELNDPFKALDSFCRFS